MDVIHERCCGLDVHKKSVVGCLIVPGPNGTRVKETRTFGTMTEELLALADWLRGADCTHVAMESTDVYWKPIYNVLEGHFILLVVNAQHIKAVPGRKTDVRDAEWLADLLRHGLVRSSFIPPVEQRVVRDLTRHRTTVIQERARIVQRIQKLLEDTNIKLSSVVTDLTGASSRDILQALLDGETDPVKLSALARGRLRPKRAQLEQALAGTLHAHHRFLLGELVRQLDFLEQSITRVSTEIAEHLRPFEDELARLDSIPGINRRIAEVLLAEIGPDITRSRQCPP